MRSSDSMAQRRAVLVVLAAAILALAGSACRQRSAPDATSSAATAPAAEASEPRKDAGRARPRIVALGDSLTAGYGLDRDEAYPALLQRRLDAAGLEYEVVNMGVSGDTSAGGVRRLDWALDGDVRLLIVALGGNDALRGLPPEQLARNLSAIIDRARERGIDVLLCGMEAPPNYGPAYTRAFRNVYRELADEKNVTLIPFILEGIAGVASLNQADGIHPTAEGAERIADLIWPHLSRIIQQQPATR